MIKLFIIFTLVFLLAIFVYELRRYFSREEKEDELRDTFNEGDLTDIELEIVEERIRQDNVRSTIDELKSEHNQKENNND